ncbi:MAG: hypothetical protein ACYC4U_23925 [Pirellulaceae bacterium]
MYSTILRRNCCAARRAKTAANSSSKFQTCPIASAGSRARALGGFGLLPRGRVLRVALGRGRGDLGFKLVTPGVAAADHLEVSPLEVDQTGAERRGEELHVLDGWAETKGKT